MIALRLAATGDLVETSLPDPVPGPGEVLLRVTHCALCRTDAKMWRNGHRDLKLPRVLGHEICGTSSDGARFVVWPGRACGTCPRCLGGVENLCPEMAITGFHRDGGLAEWVAVPEASLVPVPEGLNGDLACLAEPLACAVNGLAQVGATGTDTILVIGAGPVGLLTALAGRTLGAGVRVREIEPGRRRAVQPFLEEIDARLEGDQASRPCTVAVNAAPTPEAVAAGLDALEPGGRLCLFSGIMGDGRVPAAWLNDIHYRQLRVAGAYGCTRSGMARAVKILADHAAPARSLVQRAIALRDVPSALEAILAGETLKCVVRP